jgi:uncharacterized membrane protein
MFSKKGRLIFMVIMILISVGAYIAGLMLLPDVLVVQITSSGTAGNTMPKALGLLLQALLTLGGAIAFYFNGEGGRKKSLILSLIGAAVFILVFAFNLK